MVRAAEAKPETIPVFRSRLKDMVLEIKAMRQKGARYRASSPRKVAAAKVKIATATDTRASEGFLD